MRGFVPGKRGAGSGGASPVSGGLVIVLTFEWYPGEGGNDTHHSSRYFEPSDPVPFFLAHTTVVQQQVNVSQDLGERQVGLRDGDVAEQSLREVISGARSLGDQLVD